MAKDVHSVCGSPSFLNRDGHWEGMRGNRPVLSIRENISYLLMKHSTQTMELDYRNFFLKKCIFNLTLEHYLGNSAIVLSNSMAFICCPWATRFGISGVKEGSLRRGNESPG